MQDSDSPLSRVQTLDHWRYLGNRLQERCRARAALHTPRQAGMVTLATAGYNGNLGDQALHQITARVLRQQGLPSRGIDYCHADRWRCIRSGLIMAGGEIGDNAHFRALMTMQPDPQRCAVIGVAPTNVFLRDPDPQVLAYLRQVPVLAVRHRSGQQHLQQLLGTAEAGPETSAGRVCSTPDLAFAALSPDLLLPEPQSRQPCIGVNLLPLYLNFTRSGRFVPAADLGPMLAINCPDFNLEAATLGYVATMRRMLHTMRALGYRILHCPFSVADAAFAALVDPMAGPLPLGRCHTFAGMLRRMARCEVVVATRFHAHIAALMTRTPLISFAVAGKTMQLLQDLSLAPGLDRIQLASGGFSGDQVWTAPRQVLSSVRCQELMQQAQFVIQSAAEAVA